MRNHVEAVVEVLAEAPAATAAARSRLVAAIIAHVHRDRRRAADALDLALLQHAQQLGLQIAAAVSPISSRNSVPPLRQLEPAELALAARR